MKLASLKHGRDGRLIVVSRDLARAALVPQIAPTLQHALDNWPTCEPALAKVAAGLDAGEAGDAFAFDPLQCAAPLPRAYQWCDASAYVVHVELVRKARGAELPASFWTDPLMYQGGSDDFIGAHDDILAGDEAWGIDYEAEIAVVTDDVPMGTTPDLAAHHIKLVALLNDVSLRNLIPGELAKGFGFFQSKPATAFAPVMVSPDELGPAWDGARLHLPVVSSVNGREIGRPNAGIDMTFGFPQLIAHAARTRNLRAGAIIGSGTVANHDRSTGSSCLAEVRSLETIAGGKPVTPFLQFGDTVRIDMADASGRSIFGAIDQRVARYTRP
jgi:fumarylacetoacetate (FAA) hydrolase